MTEDFRPPSEVEKDDEPSPEVNQVDSLVGDDTGGITMGSAKKKGGQVKNNARKFWSKNFELKPSTRRQKIIGSAIAAALIVLGGSGIYALSHSFKSESEPQVGTKHKPRTHEPSNLTGIEVPVDMNKRQVTAIMIENSPDARPQSGLRDAGIVFEAVAEGGITRFNALFQEAQPSYIGPVRSVRPYYIDLFMPFGASIVHAGGSAEGLAKLRKLRAKDIDHGANAGAFQRVADRYAPHNLYTSMKALDAVNKNRKYKVSEFESLPRKKTEAPATTPKARKIDFSLSGQLYDVHYDYNSKSNSYGRIMAGTAHRDQRSGKQIAPKVVIALVMSYSQSGIYSVYKTTGKGTMYVFQDGLVTKGTWSKSGPKRQFKFTDAKGKTIELNAGQTWITLVAGADRVNYKP